MTDHEVDRRDAFDDFVRDRSRALVRLGWALTGDRQLGEDLAQEALNRLWPHWTRVCDDGDPWPYLQRIAVNLSLTWRRRRWRNEIPSAALVDEEAPDGADEVLSRSQISQWLSTLPPRQRVVIVLRFLSDLSIADTADRLRCSEGTVKSQTAKALQTLRARMEDSSEKHHG